MTLRQSAVCRLALVRGCRLLRTDLPVSCVTVRICCTRKQRLNLKRFIRQRAGLGRHRSVSEPRRSALASANCVCPIRPPKARIKATAVMKRLAWTCSAATRLFSSSALSGHDGRVVLRAGPVLVERDLHGAAGGRHGSLLHHLLPCENARSPPNRPRPHGTPSAPSADTSRRPPRSSPVPPAGAAERAPPSNSTSVAAPVTDQNWFSAANSAAAGSPERPPAADRFTLRVEGCHSHADLLTLGLNQALGLSDIRTPLQQRRGHAYGYAGRPCGELSAKDRDL